MFTFSLTSVCLLALRANIRFLIPNIKRALMVIPAIGVDKVGSSPTQSQGGWQRLATIFRVDEGG